jgi:hypothetical protein
VLADLSTPRERDEKLFFSFNFITFAVNLKKLNKKEFKNKSVS